MTCASQTYTGRLHPVIAKVRKVHKCQDIIKHIVDKLQVHASEPSSGRHLDSRHAVRMTVCTRLRFGCQRRFHPATLTYNTATSVPHKVTRSLRLTLMQSCNCGCHLPNQRYPSELGAEARWPQSLGKRPIASLTGTGRATLCRQLFAPIQ